MKENRQGCLLRPIKMFFKLSKKFEKRRQLVKKSFLTSWGGIRQDASFLLFRTILMLVICFFLEYTSCVPMAEKNEAGEWK